MSFIRSTDRGDGSATTAAQEVLGVNKMLDEFGAGVRVPSDINTPYAVSIPGRYNTSIIFKSDSWSTHVTLEAELSSTNDNSYCEHDGVKYSASVNRPSVHRVSHSFRLEHSTESQTTR